MKRLLLPLAAVAIAGLLLPAGVRPAYACTCYPPSSLEEHINKADVIAIGTVSRLFDNPLTVPDPKQEGEVAMIADVDAVVEVERYLKGTGPPQIVVDDPPSGGTCGFLDQESLGLRYLLFLGGATSPFKAHLCSGFAVLDTTVVGEESVRQILQDTQAITGPGTLPSSGGPPPETASSSPDIPVPALAALGLILLTGGGALAVYAQRKA
jgi:hypothetical protein